ncbi:MAG: hypothetical protein Q9225_003373 [Loekoesia sp. 1 TL-2023]
MNDTSLGTSVPGRFTDNHGYVEDDFSTYADIWDAVTQLYRICSVSYAAPGWLPVGKSNTVFSLELPNPTPFPHHRADCKRLGDKMSTGVFLYASNSTMDKQINGTEPDTRIADRMPEGWSYLGCNYDSDNRTLKDLSWSGENLSVERCAAYCEGKRYFGVEFGRE